MTVEVSSKADQIIIAQNNILIQLLLEIDNKVAKIDNRVTEIENQLDNYRTKDFEPELQQIYERINNITLGQTQKDKKIDTNPYIFRIFEKQSSSSSSSNSSI